MVDQIQLQLDVQTNIKSAVSQLNDLNSSVKKITTSTNLMTNAFNFAKNAILPLLALSTVVRVANDLLESADALDETFKKLSSISAQTGQNFDELKQSAIDLASDGLIPIEDAGLAIRNLLRGGLNIGQANKLLEAFKETAALGRAEGLSLADAVKNASLAFNQAARTGFQTVNAKLLSASGIFIDVKKANEEYARSIGVTVKALTIGQKQQSLLNALLAEGAKRSGDYAKAQGDFSAGFSKITAEIKLLLGELGLLFTENEKVNGSISIFGKYLELARVNIQFFTGSLSQLQFETAKARIQFDLINKARELFGVQTLKTTEQVNKNAKEMQLLVDSAKAVTSAFSKPSSGNLLTDIQKNLEKVGVTIKEVKDNADIDLTANTEQLTKDLEGVQKLLKNIGESELAQVKNDNDERNRIILDSFKRELIDNDKKNKLIAKSNQKLAFDTIKANDEIEKRRQEAIDRAIKEGEKNPVKVLYEAIPAKVTNLFKDLGVSIANAIPKQVPDFFSAAFNKLKGFFSGVGNLLSSLVPQGVKDFFKSAPSKKLTPQQQQEEDLAQAKIAAAGKALVSAIGQGAEGGKKLLQNGVEGVVGAFFGEAAGGIAGELFGVLSGGKEKVAQFVGEFTKSLPLIIESVVGAIPVFVQTLFTGLLDAILKLTDRFPDVIIDFVKGVIHAIPIMIDALIKFLPNMIGALIRLFPRLIASLASLMPSVAVSFASALIAQAPSIGTAVANEIVNQLSGKLTKIGKGAGDVFGDIGGFFSDVGSGFGFARGGELRGGTPFKDSIPVMAQGGELFVDRSTTDQLKNFLDANQQEKTMTDNIMFARLIEAMNRPQVVETEVKLNSDTFANIILKLNRQNARLA